MVKHGLSDFYLKNYDKILKNEEANGKLLGNPQSFDSITYWSPVSERLRVYKLRARKFIFILYNNLYYIINANNNKNRE